MHGRVMVVDDDRDMCELLTESLRARGCEISAFTTAGAAFEALRSADHDVVLTDLRLPDESGIDLCDRIVTTRPDVPVIVITAFGSLESAVAAIRAGAYDFVTKPIEMEMLHIAVERALRHRELRRQVKLLSAELDRAGAFDEMIGESALMRRLYDRLARVADSDATVLISGESGTGKELVARAIHARSARRDGPFVPVNCSAIPEALLESELFGHEKGAFTDARSSRRGLLVQAEAGTLFLDEIGDLPAPLQPKLLRAIEERRARPVGGEQEVAFDIRVVAATNRDLESEVEEGRFREDLFFRINVIQLQVPPLRERGGDVLLLAQHFLTHLAARADKPVRWLSPEVARKLLDYPWPGNVRELRNAIERAVALTRYEELSVEDLPDRILDHRSQGVVLTANGSTEDLLPLAEVEQRYIRHVLDATGGNKTQAARILGLDRKTLYRKLARDDEG